MVFIAQDYQDKPVNVSVNLHGLVTSSEFENFKKTVGVDSSDKIGIIKEK